MGDACQTGQETRIAKLQAYNRAHPGCNHKKKKSLQGIAKQNAELTASREWDKQHMCRLEEALRILNALGARSAEDSAGEGVHGAPHAESAHDTRVDVALAILDALGPAAAAAPNDESR